MRGLHRSMSSHFTVNKLSTWVIIFHHLFTLYPYPFCDCLVDGQKILHLVIFGFISVDYKEREMNHMFVSIFK